MDAGSTELLGQALGETGLSSIPNGGFDTTPTTLSNLQAGKTNFTIYQDPYLQGFLPTLYLYLYNISGGTISPSDTDTGLTFITKSQRQAVHGQQPVPGLDQRPEVHPARVGCHQQPACHHQHLIGLAGYCAYGTLKSAAGRPGPKCLACLPPVSAVKKEPEGEMSEITERSPQAVAPPPGRHPEGRQGRLRAALNALARQREATVFVIAVILLLYFGIKYNSTFVSQTNLANLLSETAAPIIIISIGEVFLLICGEIDLSVGFVYMLSPFLMHYLIDFYGVPVVPAIIISLLMGLVVGWSTASSPSPWACLPSSPRSGPASSSGASP